MTSVFLDTVGLIALWDEADQWHDLASPVFLGLLVARTDVVTTPAVLLECGNAAARRPYRRDVYELRERLLTDNRLVDPTSEELEQAWTDYRTGAAGEAGIVDYVSFAVMRRLGITRAFTNDKHFVAAGFEVLF